MRRIGPNAAATAGMDQTVVRKVTACRGTSGTPSASLTRNDRASGAQAKRRYMRFDISPGQCTRWYCQHRGRGSNITHALAKLSFLFSSCVHRQIPHCAVFMHHYV